MLKLIVLQDATEKDVNWEVLAETNLTESELQGLVNSIIKEFENNDLEDWTFEDIVHELEEKGCIKSVEYDKLLIYA